MNTRFYNNICQTVGKENIKCFEPMKNHTSFKIGGPADYFITPRSVTELEAVTKHAKAEGIETFVLGNGTNLLVSDQGFRGAVIQIYGNFQDYRIDEEGIIKAEAGLLLSRLARIAANEGFTGLEFASGIPGTLGGAAVMNAGAYGGELKDVLISAEVYKSGEGICSIAAEDLKLGYRTSILKHNDWIVTGLLLRLKKGDKSAIEEKMEELRLSRNEKQPLDLPSAGSTFKRPEGHFAGKLIMDANLRGYSIGGAKVSEKHCGFVVNTGDATASDVKRLIDEIKRIVYEDSGVTLVPEIRFLGDF